ncbi:transmembrane protein 236-like [Stegostoma tigrinum]|uniref:transmembrane protein 236-like n=1 Tax=Stegostoma tigrinum TaxID=3053191 RepID=UPI00286FC14F|nr:transmembrane protein 236-like [Stegostoma tigrinum]
MISVTKINFFVFEVLQFAALCVPTIVVAEHFAFIFMEKSEPVDFTSYQLILACSVAYVACVSLIIWVPVKFLIFKKHILSEVKEWQPALLMHLIFTTLPCFGFIIAGSQVQSDPKKMKTFSDFPVSLVLMCLIVVDIIEHLRKWRLTGNIDGTCRDGDFASNGPVLTNIEQVSTVSAHQNRPHEENQAPPGVTENEFASSVAQNKSHNVLQYEYSEITEHNVPDCLKVLAVNDYRAKIFVTSIINWLDTVELVRVAGLSNVFLTGWIYPIYIFSYLSLLRIILHSANPFLPLLTVVFQDFPFLFIRISIIGAMGFVTPILYPLKNIIVVVTFIYFNYVTKAKCLNRTQRF